MEYTVTHSLFALTMLVCGTYMLAAFSFRNSIHVFSDDAELKVDTFLYVICFINICLAVWGVMLIKIKASHVCHAIYFCILLGIAVPTLSGFAIIMQGKAKNTTEMENIVSAQVVDYWRKHRDVWPVLQAAELNQDCCGLKGPSDYRDFIYNRNATEGTPCEEEEYDVPYSCAKLQNLYERCKDKDLKVYCNAFAFTREVILFDDPTVTKMLQGMDARNKSRYKCENAKMSVKPKNCDPAAYSISKEGCMPVILGNLQDLRESHYVLFCLIPFLSFITLLSFMAYWCDVDKAAKKKQMSEPEPEPEDEPEPEIEIIKTGPKRSTKSIGSSRPLHKSNEHVPRVSGNKLHPIRKHTT